MSSSSPPSYGHAYLQMDTVTMETTAKKEEIKKRSQPPSDYNSAAAPSLPPFPYMKQATLPTLVSISIQKSDRRAEILIPSDITKEPPDLRVSNEVERAYDSPPN